MRKKLLVHNETEPENESRTVKLTVRLNEADHEELVLQAKAHKLKISEYIRLVLFKHRHVYMVSNFEAYRELLHLHNDLNRIANYLIGRGHTLNVDGQVINDLTEAAKLMVQQFYKIRLIAANVNSNFKL